MKGLCLLSLFDHFSQCNRFRVHPLLLVKIFFSNNFLSYVVWLVTRSNQTDPSSHCLGIFLAQYTFYPLKILSHKNIKERNSDSSLNFIIKLPYLFPRDFIMYISDLSKIPFGLTNILLKIIHLFSEKTKTNKQTLI